MIMKKTMASLCLGIGLCVGSTNVMAASSIGRIDGSNRFGTSTAVSKVGWTKTCDMAIIASGENFPDALSAGPLAKMYNAPIFLTSKDSLDNKSGSIDTTVSSELKRLKVKKVIIVGGTGAVSKKVEKQVKNLGITTQRYEGLNRYETSVEIAKKVGSENGVVIATGENFKDALAISPIASAKKMPIILVQKDTIPKEVKNYLKENKVDKTYIIGGTGVVAEKLEKEFKNPTRLAGKDIYKTNMAVLNEFKKDLNFENVYVCTDKEFADALSGSSIASNTKSPIILVGNNPQEDLNKFFSSNSEEIKNIKVLGGQGAVTKSTVQNIVAQLNKKDLDKAFVNALDLKSQEATFNLGLKASAEGFDKETQEFMNTIIAYINNAKIDSNMKYESNDKDGTFGKQEVDFSLYSQFTGRVNSKIWVDNSDEKAGIKETIEVPEILKKFLPEKFKDKKYVSILPLDLNSKNLPSEVKDVAIQANCVKDSMKIQKKVINLIKNYIPKWNPTCNYLNFAGLETIDTKEGKKLAKCFEINLNDSDLKYVLSYTVNNILNDKEAIKDIKDIYTELTKDIKQEKQEKEQVDKFFRDLENNPKEVLKDFNKFMDSIKNIKILGDKGVQEKIYIVDNEIVKCTGVTDFKINVKELAGKGAKELKGNPVIKITLSVDSSRFNLGKEQKLEMPKLDEKNSFNLVDLIKEEFSNPEENKEVQK